MAKVLFSKLYEFNLQVLWIQLTSPLYLQWHEPVNRINSLLIYTYFTGSILFGSCGALHYTLYSVARGEIWPRRSYVWGYWSNLEWCIGGHEWCQGAGTVLSFVVFCMNSSILFCCDVFGKVIINELVIHCKIVC